ncbi:MAG: hypothetical protein IKU40_03080 [Clostridia bacterium]|nr:hypothetical protein [Clostridia bacterium]
MTTPRLPYSDLALNLSIIIIPLVFLFVWLFNSYRLGKVRRPVFICGTVLILITLVLLIVFA